MAGRIRHVTDFLETWSSAMLAENSKYQVGKEGITGVTTGPIDFGWFGRVSVSGIVGTCR